MFISAVEKFFDTLSASYSFTKERLRQGCFFQEFFRYSKLDLFKTSVDLHVILYYS